MVKIYLLFFYNFELKGCFKGRFYYYLNIRLKLGCFLIYKFILVFILRLLILCIFFLGFIFFIRDVRVSVGVGFFYLLVGIVCIY